VHSSGCTVNGCIDYSTALVAVLRARNIPAVFVRRLIYSSVYFFTGEKWMEADVFYGKISNPDPKDMKRFEQALAGKPSKVFGAGRDSASIGIHSLADFHRFVPGK